MSSESANIIQSSTLSEPPSEPKPAAQTRRGRTRRRIYGGFILTDEEAFKWANRLLASRGEDLITFSRWDEANCLITLDERVKEAGGIKVNFHGKRRPEKGGACDQFIVITQEGVGVFEYGEDGRPVMDFEQKLVMGRFEERAKELLRLEGVQHSEYETIFA